MYLKIINSLAGELYSPAKRLLSVIRNRFNQYGFPLNENRNIIPDDDTTLFVCSGMQKFKSLFNNPDGTVQGSLQSCIRTNDLDSVGDGHHLTSFTMIGNFSFEGPEYEVSTKMWSDILSDLQINSIIHVHPEREDHKNLWLKLGHQVVYDKDCVWSDGNIGGYCCEVYHKELEIGNLVNTLDKSTDVGFGLERMLKVIENKPVDETCLFDVNLPPIVRDHVRTLLLMRENGIVPGNKGRNYVCRKLLRKILNQVSEINGLNDWFDEERKLLDDRVTKAKKALKKHKNKSPEWWWDTFGVFLEEII